MSSEDDDPNTQYHSPPPFCCPSFNTYSNDTRIADIATRVTRSSPQYDDVLDDFEFNLGSGSVDQGIRPVYPLFDPGYSGPDNPAALQLRDLFFQEDGSEPPRYSSASSDDDENDVRPRAAYCLWAPKSPPPPPPAPSPSRCTKSNSTGSVPDRAGSKRWKLKNLLRRSRSSDAKQGLLLFTPKNKQKKEKEKEKPPSTVMSNNNNSNGRRHSMDSNHSSNNNNNYYSGNYNKGVFSPARFEWENKRKSYLPYKQDLLGLFGSPQSLRKINIPPF